ncbi:type II toxin-antitoxin system HicA family toxin [Candidatus Parcubacteria bacterium]|nr:type II toxin-antitoxin system HicA family toxin [Candidatus Parcubacteria bacterium]
MVIRFLKKQGFIQTHERGSHFYYSKKTGSKSFLVTVSVHGSDSIHPKTIKSIIVQSGIPQSEWVK